MRILVIPDAPNWAIGALCKGIIKHNPQYDFEFIAAHPRGLGEAIPAIREALERGVDIVHFHYWNSAIQLMDLLPELRDPKIKKILTHHNHHRLTKRDWKEFDALTEWTDWGVDVLKKIHPNVHKVTYGIDLDRFSYLPSYPPETPAVGYIGRVVPWKNLGEITRVSKELGYKVIASGFIDKPDYWQTVDKSNLEFNGGMGLVEMAPANVKDNLYARMSVFVMYSTEEKESGTVPLLEAMARGVPILATEQGMARELIQDGKNGVLFTPENFKEKLKMVMEDEALRQSMRKAAWDTIKQYPEEKMAREFAKVYHRVLHPGMPLVSTIITSFNRPDGLLETMMSIDKQDYPNKEVIVADDGSTDPRVKLVVNEAKKILDVPIRLIENPDKQGYGLAKMRNLAVMEALGSHILVLQDRFTLDDDMLLKIVQKTAPRAWGFGAKKINGQLRDKKSFVENFAWILKDDLVAAGGFNERVDLYGGQSEELRRRFSAQGYVFNYHPDVTLTEVVSSKGINNKRDQVWKAKWQVHRLFDHI